MPKPKARVRLTERFIASLKPGSRTVFDHDLPRFAVRVTEAGHKSFVIVARVGGRQRWVTVGTVGVKSLADARDAAREMLVRVEKGEEPKPRKADTFEAIAARFIAEYARPRNRTWHDQERILRVYCTPWAGRDITTISRQDVRDLRDRVAREHGPIMSNRTLSAVRKLFTWALEDIEIISASPAAGVKPAAEENSRERFLSDAELRAFWRATGEMPYPWGPFLRMLALTGQRLSEVAGMRWQDIDGTLWTVPRTKEGRRHEVPLSPAAMDVLAGVPRFTGPYVFTTGNGTKHVKDMSGPKARLDRAMPTGGHWTLHDLRRTCSTVLARLGIAQQVNAKCLDHFSGGLNSIDAIYNRYGYDAEKRDALERWALHLTADNVVTLPIAHVVKLVAPRLPGLL